MRRLLILSLLFVASSCGGGSGLSCHKSGGSIPVSVGSNLDASGVHHSVVDNSTDDSSDQSSIPGDSQSSTGNQDSPTSPDDQSSDVSLIDDSPDQSSIPGDNQSSPDGPTDSDSPVSEIDPDSVSPDDSPSDGPSDEVSSPDQSSVPGDNQSSTTSLDLPDPQIAPGGTSEGSLPATYFVIWNGRSYEPSHNCVTVMWGRLCLN